MVPAAALMAMALAAAERATGAAAGVDDFFIHRPLPLAHEEIRTVQTIVTAGSTGHALEIQSIGAGGSDWTLHVTGHVAPMRAGAETAPERPDAIAARCSETVPVQQHYDGLA